MRLDDVFVVVGVHNFDFTQRLGSLVTVTLVGSRNGRTVHNFFTYEIPHFMKRLL